MSELKAVHAFDVYEAYTKTGDDDAAKVYLKSEADKVIAHNKYKRCLAMAKRCFSKSNYHFVLARHGEDVKENKIIPRSKKPAIPNKRPTKIIGQDNLLPKFTTGTMAFLIFNGA